MSRWLESKFIEQQMEDYAATRKTAKGRVCDAALRERRKLLQLDKTRTLENINRTNNSQYKAMLVKALRDIEKKLMELEK